MNEYKTTFRRILVSEKQLGNLVGIIPVSLLEVVKDSSSLEAFVDPKVVCL